MPEAVVRVWNEDEGWGVADCDQTPGGCFVHFSHFAGEGYKVLHVGQRIDLECERFEQDGYQYRATVVRPLPAD